MAEVDGNRTRRTGITHPTRFEGGGAHQALGHLHQRPYWLSGKSPTLGGRVKAMSKNRKLMVIVLAALLIVLARKVKDV